MICFLNPRHAYFEIVYVNPKKTNTNINDIFDSIALIVESILPVFCINVKNMFRNKKWKIIKL